MSRAWILLTAMLTSQLAAGPDDRQPAYLLEIPPSVATVLIAETDASTLHLYENTIAGIDRRGETYMSVGENGVGKARAWDRRTPLGIYFVNERLDTSRLHEKYGPVAFPLDYPNIWDRLNRRGGDGIWIHGVLPGGGRRPPRDTDGCIALPNDDILALEPRMVPRQTPVLITRTIRWTSAQQVERDRERLRSALETWARSFAEGDLYLHLSLYADDFSYRGMTRQEWASFRTQSLNQAPPTGMAIDDVLLLGDPEDRGLYLSRFRQSIAYGDRTVETTKRLYWRRTGDDTLQIVAEDNG